MTVDGKDFIIKFTPDVNLAKKYFVYDILLRFENEEKERLKPLKKAKEFNINIENELQKNMMNVIGDKKNAKFYFRKFYFRGKNIEEKLFREIDYFNEILKLNKICIYVHTTKLGLKKETGLKLREYLTFNKEDSPIVFSYFNENEKKGAVAFVNLIGIKTN